MQSIGSREYVSALVRAIMGLPPESVGHRMGATIGTAKTACNGKLLVAASTEDGSGFFNADTTLGSFTTSSQAVAIGQQQRFKQANGSWATNPWTLTGVTGNLKYLNQAGTSVTVASLTISSRSIGEVISEWDGTYFQVTLLQQALGGYRITTPPLVITTANTIPALPAAWSGFDTPTMTFGGNTVAHQPSASTTAAAATTASTTVTVASATNIYVGQAVSGTGVTAGTLVTAISGTTITLSQPATIANSATLTFSSAVTFTSGSTSVAVNQYALGFNVNPNDVVFATLST